jgi:hypothetical protein
MAACPVCSTALLPGGACPRCLLAAGLAAPAADDALPDLALVADLIPDHEILGLIGRGGMGAVYRARHRRLDRLVALKVLPLAGAAAGRAERFAVEAQALARLHHPHIVAVHDAGHAGDLCWLSMELVEGTTLRQELARRRLDPAEALALVQQVCAALQYAHDHGVVHRDIKPDNILIDRHGQALIADFGLARLAGGDADARLTRDGMVVGTPHYMAPEQVERPLAVDHRADLYSLGVVLYEMLTGELPLGRFPMPSQRVEVDVRLDAVVLRALEKSPERRYQQASQLGGQVGRIAAGRGGGRWWPLAPALLAAAALGWWLLPPPATPSPPPPAASAPTPAVDALTRARSLAASDAGLLRDQRFATLAARFAPALAERLEAGALAALWRDQERGLGACLGVDPAQVSEHDGLHRTVARCRFATQCLDLVLAYDRDERIAGLWLLPPSP